MFILSVITKLIKYIYQITMVQEVNKLLLIILRIVLRAYKTKMKNMNINQIDHARRCFTKTYDQQLTKELLYGVTFPWNYSYICQATLYET